MATRFNQSIQRIALHGEAIYPYTNVNDWINFFVTDSYVRTSGANANYKFLKASGSPIPPVPMTLLHEKRMTGVYSFENHFPDDDATLTFIGTGIAYEQLGLPNLGSDVIPDMVTRASTQAENKFRKKAASAFASASIGTALGEYKQTASLVATNIERLARAANAIRRMDFGGLYSALDLSGQDRKRARKTLTEARIIPPVKRVSAIWLELQYGWKPLLHDIYDTCMLLNEQWVRGFSAHPLHASATSYEVVELVSSPGVDRMGAGIFDVKVKMGGTLYREDPASQGLAAAGLNNPASIAWELVPYSFVVDWFLPVGDYLKARTELDGTVLRNGYKSTKIKVRSKGHFTFVKSPIEYSVLTGGDPVAAYEGQKYSLELVTGVPEVKPPSLRDWLSSTKSPVTRIANAASLLLVLLPNRLPDALKPGVPQPPEPWYYQYRRKVARA